MMIHHVSPSNESHTAHQRDCRDGAWGCDWAVWEPLDETHCVWCQAFDYKISQEAARV